MKQLMICFLLSIFVFSLVGCENQSPGSIQRIVPPENLTMNLMGTWVIEKCFDKDFKPMNKSNQKKWENKKVEFSDKSVLVVKKQWNDVIYKVKRVNSDDYFLYSFRIAAEKAGMKGQEVWVFTVTSEGKFLYEFVETRKDELFTELQGKFFCLKKRSDKIIKEMDIESEDRGNNSYDNAKIDFQNGSSGLILGLRSPKIVDDCGITEYSYRTLWLAYDGKKLYPVLQDKDILMPRMNGFWKVKIRKINGKPGSEDVLSAKILTGAKPKSISNFKKNLKQDIMKMNVMKSIQFAGNDYICLELQEELLSKGKGSKIIENRYQFIPVDSITNSNGVNITDLAGRDGLTAMRDAQSKLVDSLKNDGPIVISKQDQDENFSLVRRTGHWFFTGRLNYYRGGKAMYSDYNINLIPASKLVFYDTLYVPWTNIKDRVPDATDAYTSPNKSIAVVLTKNMLFIYKIVNDELALKPIKKMELKEGEMPVMAEWAKGEYVDNWNTVFLNE